MPSSIFINLPVRNLQHSMGFYEAIGAPNNPMFTDHSAACMVFSDTIHVMLLTHEKWQQFTLRPIPDAQLTAQVILALSRDSRDEVDSMVSRAIRAGGRADPTPIQDMGYMYGRSFEDPDGHIWEIMWMDPAVVPPASS